MREGETSKGDAKHQTMTTFPLSLSLSLSLSIYLSVYLSAISVSEYLQLQHQQAHPVLCGRHYHLLRLRQWIQIGVFSLV